MTERELIKTLAQRYLKMIGLSKDQHLRNMCLSVIDKSNIAPLGKLNRWIGFIQKGVVDHKLTTISRENSFMTPLFENTYEEKNIKTRPD